MIQFSLAREQGETPVLRPPFNIKGLRCDGNAELYAWGPHAVQRGTGITAASRYTIYVGYGEVGAILLTDDHSKHS